MTLSFTACSSLTSVNPTNGSDAEISAVNSENVQSASASQPSEQETELSQQDDSDQSDGNSNILVAYFSLAGEQYGVGVVEQGNTSIIAHMIAQQTGADLFEIEPVDSYPTTYDELLDVARTEMSENARPQIADSVENMDDYDTVFIGYPIWWGDLPMIVYNFLESYDLSDKTIIPFCTHGGSGLSGTQSTIADITQGNMVDGLAIAGTTAQNDSDAALQQVTQWLTENGFIE